jgi:hypothetical protein
MAQTAAPDAVEGIEEITVVGRFPGPPLWKVTSEGRVLWIFGELSPVPKGLDWDDRNARRVIERADAAIAAPRVKATTWNPLRLFRLFRDARRLSRLDGKETLADVLQARHLDPGERDERVRPAVAALRLYAAALEDIGLTTDTNIEERIGRLVRRSRVRESEPAVKTRPELVMAELHKVDRASEVACFATVLTTIETDLAEMKARADAWALGDVAALERFDYPDYQGECLTMLFTATGLKELRDELYAAWLLDAERSLTAHAVTFSVLPMRELVAADGLLAQLAARGYTVSAP